jgi:hypothetical protein
VTITGHGSDYDQLRGLVEIFTERANQAIGQADEMTAMLQRTVDASQEQWRDTAVRVLDDSLELDDAGLRRKLERLRDALAAGDV